MAKQAYVVLVGLKPGVYTNWLDVTQNTVGVPRAQYQGFTYFDDAVKYYERAHRKGATRKVTKPPPAPSDEDEDKREGKGRKKQPEGRSGGSEGQAQPRRRQDSNPAPIVQASTSRGSSAGKAARDAQIAAALADARKNRIGPSASSPSVISSERRQFNKSSRHAALARSATEPAYHLQPQVQGSPTVSSRTPSRPARRTRDLPRAAAAPAEPDLARSPRTPETQAASTRPASDISTHKTQTRNRFDNSPGLSTPRYAQSLSYASSPSLSLSLASSDLRTHLSSPSSFGTRYFPEDWLARLEQRRELGDRGLHGEDQSSVLSVSEYATAPNTPEMGSVQLEDDDDEMRGVPNASPSTGSRVGWSEPSSSRSLANPKSRPKTWSSAMSPPATPTQVISSPSATSTPRRTGSTSNSVNDSFAPSLASVPPSSPPPKPTDKRKTAAPVTRSRSEAEVQTDSPPQVRRRKNPEAAVQAAPPSPHKRQHLDNQVQTSPVTSPLRESTGVKDIPVRPSVGGAPCACEHPEYACLHCGQRPRTERCGACSALGHSRSSRAPSMTTTTASPAQSILSSASSSPAPFATPASAISSSVSTRSSSSRSRVGGHTPLMGPSEARVHSRSPTAHIQESLSMMSFSEAAHGVGAEAVVHDMSFDPRSPLQRGTSVPAGTSGSAVRPSPAMAPVPIGSLGLLFPPS